MNIAILAFLLITRSLFTLIGEGKTSPLASDIVFQSPDSTYYARSLGVLASNIVFQSSDGGQAWEDISAGLPKDFQVWLVYSGDGEVIIGSENGLYRNSKQGRAWEKALLPGERITNVFPGQTGPYAYSFESGFFQEMLGSGIWIPLDNTLKDKVVTSLLETSNGTVFAGSYMGILKSIDGRKTWKQVYDESTITGLISMDGLLVASSSEGMLRSTDEGEHWDLIESSVGKVVKISIVDDGIAAIFVGDKGSAKEVNKFGRRNNLLASNDGGITWERIDAGLPSVRDINDIVQAGKYLFCSLDTGIYRSSDRGKTWELVFASTDQMSFDLSVSGQVVIAVKVFGGC